MYTKERAVQDENPLKWWKQNVSKYPTLSVLARQYLSIPGTSVPSERIFSCAGLVVSKLRNRLSSSLVDQIIFLSKNYVPEQKTDDWFKYQIVFFCMFSCVIGVGIDKWLTCVCYVYKCTWNLVIILLSVIDLLPMYDRKSFYTTS